MRYQRPHSGSFSPSLSQPSRVIDPRRARQRLVRALKSQGIADGPVLAAIGAIPRHNFVPEALASHAYDNISLSIGLGQTISQPFTVARMLELLEVEPGMRVLEIGMGSGYQTALLAHMGCVVFGVERLKELYQIASRRLRSLGFGRVQTIKGDGTLGLPQAAPFDRIIVAAGSPLVPPPLLEQLEEGGVMVIPVGTLQRDQRLLRLLKRQGKIYSSDMGPAVFVDLVGDHGWPAAKIENFPEYMQHKSMERH